MRNATKTINEDLKITLKQRKFLSEQTPLSEIIDPDSITAA